MNIYILPEVYKPLPSPGFREDILAFALRPFLTKYQLTMDFFPKTDIFCLLHPLENEIEPVDEHATGEQYRAVNSVT